MVECSTVHGELREFAETCGFVILLVLAIGLPGGAYLDVFEHEPLDPTSPLWDMPNVLVSPHTASHSLGQNEAIFEIFLDNLASWRAGRKLRNDVDDLG